MRAGLLDRNITIEKRAAGADATYGGISSTWVPVATVWAEISDLTGREYLMAATVQAQRTVQVMIRYLPGLTAAMRLRDGDRILQINAVAMQGRRAWHVLQCSDFNQAAQT